MRYIYLLTFYVFLYGCSINPKIPINRYHTSESLGEGVSSQLFLGGSSDINIESDLASSPIDLTPGNLGTSLTPGAGLDFSVFDSFDIGLDYALSGPFRLKANWQLLGDSRKDAKMWSYSLALLGSAGASIQSRTLRANNGSTRVFWIGSVYHDYEAAAGLRVIDALQLTVGAWYAKYGIDVDMGSVQIDTKGEVKGYHLLASYYFPNMAIKLDIAKYWNYYQDRSDDMLDSDKGLQFGLAVDFNF